MYILKIWLHGNYRVQSWTTIYQFFSNTEEFVGPPIVNNLWNFKIVDKFIVNNEFIKFCQIYCCECRISNTAKLSDWLWFLIRLI